MLRHEERTGVFARRPKMNGSQRFMIYAGMMSTSDSRKVNTTAKTLDASTFESKAEYKGAAKRLSIPSTNENTFPCSAK